MKDEYGYGPVLFLLGFVACIAIGYILLNPHKDDARLKAECESRGGVFVEARDPLHVCVTPK